MAKKNEPDTWQEMLAKKRVERMEDYNFGKEVMKAVFWVTVGSCLGIGLALIAIG